MLKNKLIFSSICARRHARRSQYLTDHSGMCTQLCAMRVSTNFIRGTKTKGRLLSIKESHLGFLRSDL